MPICQVLLVVSVLLNVVLLAGYWWANRQFAKIGKWSNW